MCEPLVFPPLSLHLHFRQRDTPGQNPQQNAQNAPLRKYIDSLTPKYILRHLDQKSPSIRFSQFVISLSFVVFISKCPPKVSIDSIPLNKNETLGCMVFLGVNPFLIPLSNQQASSEKSPSIRLSAFHQPIILLLSSANVLAKRFSLLGHTAEGFTGLRQPLAQAMCLFSVSQHGARICCNLCPSGS